jgi:hypothetical protein
MFYTGFMNDDRWGQPRVLEQGREFDELVKKDGNWLISRRVLRSDTGIMPAYKGFLTEEEFQRF